MRLRLAASTFICCFLFSLCAASAVLASTPTTRSSPRRVTIFDLERCVDENHLNMFVTNFGSFAWNLTNGNAGLYFPRGTDKTVMFAGGLWLAATVDGEVRTAVAEYTQEYGPGPMIGGGPSDPGAELYKVFKVARYSGDPADTSHLTRVANPAFGEDELVHHSWTEYINGAEPLGAPYRFYRLPRTSTPDPTDSVDVAGPDMSGDLMTWAVYNDADPQFHTARAGGTPPLGVEVQQKTFAFLAGPLQRTVFVEFKIINKGSLFLQDMFLGLWTDPDLGTFTDDLTGCNVPRALGYAYNANNSDGIYGAAPPAVGVDLLRGARTAGGGNLGLYAFTRYINGTDPTSVIQVYNYMKGLNPDGSPIIDPTNGFPTRYMVNGDPLNLTGWVDTNPSDRRMLLSTGPITMAPGDTQQVVVAIVVGQGPDRLSSISSMLCEDNRAQYAFDHGFPDPLPPISCEPPPENCPRPAAFWRDQCLGAGQIDAQEFDAVASRVDDISNFYSWANHTQGFCEVVSAPVGDLRAAAKREFVSLLANLASGELGVDTPGGNPIRLLPGTQVTCDGFGPRTIGALGAQADLAPSMIAADYLDLNAAHPTPLIGVDAGLSPFFDGGAGPAAFFFGSSLDPIAQPDSFSTVELRFSTVVTQKAYRFLRLEKQSDGGAPPQGRAYLYGGFLTVPFTCWDTKTNTQLDVAFVERTVTDDNGTILDIGSQPATHDSTWAPDASVTGGREYLVVLRRPYDGTLKPSVAVDGAFADPSQPFLYALWARRLFSSSVIDDGDRFRWEWGLGPAGSVDALLTTLESEPLGDPSVAQHYQQIVDCLGAINAGVGIGPTCDQATPTLVSLVSAEGRSDRVTIVWSVSADPGTAMTVERSTGAGAWTTLAPIAADGEGLARFEDTDVAAGQRLGYRLRVIRAGESFTAGEAWVDVPSQAQVALAGIFPNPAHGQALFASFSLASRERATLELIDLAGRRVWSREVGGLGPGSHVVPVANRGLASGVFVLRLRQGAQVVSRKAAIVR
jgi:hypothetical protein